MISRILVVGVGGLGCPASLALARAGVGHLTLVDPDVIDVTNLHRQPWYLAEDLGQPKVEVAARRLRAAFPGLQVEALREQLAPHTLTARLGRGAVTLDCTDSTATKFQLSDAAVAAGVPLISGGVLRLAGQAMAIVPGGPCLRCLFEEAPPEGPSCAQAGVLGSVAGVVGALMASLALQPLPHGGAAPLHLFDGATFRSRTVTVHRAADCPACGAGPVLEVPHGA
jgi:molybdopterin-synthase adenylyltransferase